MRFAYLVLVNEGPIAGLGVGQHVSAGQTMLILEGNWRRLPRMAAAIAVIGVSGGRGPGEEQGVQSLQLTHTRNQLVDDHRLTESLLVVIPTMQGRER